ncbi:MAG: hypothetical protein IJ682_13295 [Lachnospiraceae bacterium]|nr:hypothetical protein [Lachnospiraceae bacterium]
MRNTAEILQIGMNCLQENIGVVETEYFISAVLREQMDYTKWRQRYYDRITDDEVKEDIYQYIKEHPKAFE